MREIGREKLAKWVLLGLLLIFLLLPVWDLIRVGSLGTWSPLYYLDFVVFNMGGYYGLTAIVASLLSLAAWGFLCGGHKFGKTLMYVLFGPAVLIYLILFLYVLLTIFFKNRHNTFLIELIDYGLKCLLSVFVLFLQHNWRGKYL